MMQRRNKRLTVVAVVLGLLGLLGSIGLIGTANAQPTQESRTTVERSAAGTGDAGTRACVWEPAPGVDAVSVRARPRTDSTRIGIMYAGQAAFGACPVVIGLAYTACGRPISRYWAHIYWGQTHGYVAASCVR